jgi:hypothetical protein
MSKIKYEELSIDALTQFCTQEYKELSLREKELDKAKKVLFTKMAEENQSEVKSPFGRFYRYVRTVYSYPEDVIAIKNALSEAEEKAKAEGRATKQEIPSYKFGELKKDDEESNF